MIRFTLLGIPVTVHWMFWAVMAMLGANLLHGPRGLALLMLWVLAGFISILIHELGHALLWRKFGGHTRIALDGMGGVAISNRTLPRGKDILVSLAGPVLQIAVGYGAKLLMAHSREDAWYIEAFLDSFILVSIYWGLINLLPIYPLDGGHVLKGILGPKREKLAYLVGMLCAAAVCIYVITLPNPRVLSAIFCCLFAWENFQRWQGRNPPSEFAPR